MKIRQPCLKQTGALKFKWNVSKYQINACKIISYFVACWLFYQIWEIICFTKNFSCGLSIPTLKSQKINIFHILRNVSLRIFLMLPDGLLSSPYEDHRNNLSIIFHSVGLVLHNNLLYVFERIYSLMYNLIPPPFASPASLHG